MDIARQAAFLRAARAFLGLELAEAALGAGLAENTVTAAEKARTCTDKTWSKLVSYYRQRGLAVIENEELAPVALRPLD